MDHPQPHHLATIRYYELRLLRCTLSSPPSTPPSHQSPPSNLHPLHPLIEEITTHIESGRYLDALSSTGTKTIFPHLALDSPDPAKFYAELESTLHSFLRATSDDVDHCFAVLLVTSVAVAAMLAFLQCNFTGPVIELPLVPLPWIEVKEGGGEWEAWARLELMSAGSELAAKFSNLQYLVFSKILLTGTRDLLFGEGTARGFGTNTWWLARVILLQQQVLCELCSSLFDILQVFMAENLNHFGDVEKVSNYWGVFSNEEEVSAIVSMLQLETGIVELKFARIDSARQFFKAAELALGLDLSLTGALGFRRAHQAEPKVQMVLVVNRSPLPNAGSSPLTSCSQQGDASSCTNLQHNNHEIREHSDVLMTPRIIDSGGNEMNGLAGDVTLTPIHQAVVLAQCLLIEKSAALDELQRWKMAPYIEAIDSQQSSCFSIKFSCNITRIRWESTRSQTKERACLMMNNMVQDLFEPSPRVQERVHCCFGVHIPAVPVLRKEYVELLISRGMIGEALKTFEDLELWDNLIHCYCLLEKKAAAVELINTRLLETPNDPRLWCSLGDVTNDDTCYEKALKVSNDKSMRAKRSLARIAYKREDYERSKVLWDSAMASNSLYPDGWFALGAAALKARDINKALYGFTRAIQVDPDNGEAWNNIACLHMIRNKGEEAFVAFKEALKIKRDSWQMWENFGEVAADIGNFHQALEAIVKVLDLSKNRRYDRVLLQRIMQELERRISSQNSAIATSDEDCSTETASGLEFQVSRETQGLMELLGKVLRQIVLNTGNGDMWGLYARWHRMRGDLTMCLEALKKQVRSHQGSEAGNDLTQFKKLAHASLELSNTCMEVAASPGSHRELHSAEMHLRSTIKRASAFSDTEEFKALQICLVEVETRLKNKSMPMS